nr:hypothetical protein [Escherichia coli]
MTAPGFVGHAEGFGNDGEASHPWLFPFGFQSSQIGALHLG